MTAPAIPNWSEVDILQGGHIASLGVIVALANLFAGDNIENAQNLAASVTLTEHRDENLLGHSWVVRC